MTTLKSHRTYKTTCSACGQQLRFGTGAIQYEGGREILVGDCCVDKFASSFIQDWSAQLDAEAKLRPHQRQALVAACKNIISTMEFLDSIEHLVNKESSHAQINPTQT